MSTMNRMRNARNPHQGPNRKVLCVCSAGLLRSPTTAAILSRPPWNFNTRAAGLSNDYALIPVDPVLLSWADDVVVMEPWMAEQLRPEMEKHARSTPVHVLDIPDNYGYMDDKLVMMIRERAQTLWPRQKG